MLEVFKSHCATLTVEEVHTAVLGVSDGHTDVLVHGAVLGDRERHTEALAHGAILGVCGALVCRAVLGISEGHGTADDVLMDDPHFCTWSRNKFGRIIIRLQKQ